MEGCTAEQRFGFEEIAWLLLFGKLPTRTQLEKFRELQPDAVIFVQGIMKVAKEKSDKDPIFNNVGIEQRNERIAALADGKNIFYLDMNEVVCDEEGNLKSSLTFDDIHLYGSKYGIWVDYLKENGI